MPRHYNDGEDDVTYKNFQYYLDKAGYELTHDNLATDDEIKNLAASYALGADCDFNTYEWIYREARFDCNYIGERKTQAELIVFVRENSSFYLDKYKKIAADDAKTKETCFSTYLYDNQLYRLKYLIFETLEKYICFWKLSLFGHHHDKRANYVKAAISAATNLESIQNILANEKCLMEAGKLENNPVSDRPLIENEFPPLANEAAYINSGYYKVVVEALSIAMEIQQCNQLRKRF